MKPLPSRTAGAKAGLATWLVFLLLLHQLPPDMGKTCGRRWCVLCQQQVPSRSFKAVVTNATGSCHGCDGSEDCCKYSVQVADRTGSVLRMDPIHTHGRLHQRTQQPLAVVLSDPALRWGQNLCEKCYIDNRTAIQALQPAREQSQQGQQQMQAQAQAGGMNGVAAVLMVAMASDIVNAGVAAGVHVAPPVLLENAEQCAAYMQPSAEPVRSALRRLGGNNNNNNNNRSSSSNSSRTAQPAASSVVGATQPGQPASGPEGPGPSCPLPPPPRSPPPPSPPRMPLLQPGATSVAVPLGQPPSLSAAPLPGQALPPALPSPPPSPPPLGQQDNPPQQPQQQGEPHEQQPSASLTSVFTGPIRKEEVIFYGMLQACYPQLQFSNAAITDITSQRKYFERMAPLFSYLTNLPASVDVIYNYVHRHIEGDKKALFNGSKRGHAFAARINAFLATSEGVLLTSVLKNGAAPLSLYMSTTQNMDDTCPSTMRSAILDEADKAASDWREYEAQPESKRLDYVQQSYGRGNRPGLSSWSSKVTEHWRVSKATLAGGTNVLNFECNQGSHSPLLPIKQQARPVPVVS